MNKLVYANHKWCLTVDGKQVPNSKIVYDSLKMKNDEVPIVEIVVDEIAIEDVDIVENKGYVEDELNDGCNGLR